MSKVQELLAKAKERKEAEQKDKPSRPALIETKKMEQEEDTSGAFDPLLEINDQMLAIENFDADQFVDMLPRLEEAIEAKAPGIAKYMQDINKNLTQYEELAYILNPDQQRVLVSGLLFLTNTDLASKVTKKGSRGKMSIDQAEALF